MANEEHLEWLREGVEAWNKRRELTPFFPELSDMVTTQNELMSVNFSSLDLRHAKLNGIDLTNANLSGSELNVTEFKLAILCGANFLNSDVSGAIFDGANVKSDIKSKLYTNLDAHGLKQEQLNSMIGDSGTIIPDHLTRPDHWEALPKHRGGAEQHNPETDDTFEDAPNHAPTEKPREYYQHLALNLTREPIKSAAVLRSYGQQLMTATRMYRDTHQMIPDDVILIEQIAATMTHMATAVQSETAELEDRIKELEAQITTLNETIKIQAMALNNGDQTVKTALIVAAGTAVLTPICTAAGASILEASSYVFGQGSNAFQGLYDTIKNHFAVRPPEPPSGNFTDV